MTLASEPITDLGQVATTEICDALRPLLADVFALYVKTKSFHWHISGRHFRDYHLLLDEQAGQILAMTDVIAERARTLGGTTLRSIGDVTRHQRLRDNDTAPVGACAMLCELRDDNEPADPVAQIGSRRCARATTMWPQRVSSRTGSTRASVGPGSSGRPLKSECVAWSIHFVPYSKEHIAMSRSTALAPRSEKGLLTPDNCVVALIDLQPQMLFGMSNFDRQSIINSNVALSKAARVFDVPMVLTTVESKAFSGYMWPQIQAIFPDQTPIERSTMNSWDDENFVAAVRQSGRKKLVLAGLWTETCVALPTIQAIHDGYDVYVVEDCCGDVSQLAHDNAMKRMIQAGAKPVTALSVLLEWQRDWAATRDLRRRAGHREDAFRRLRRRRRVRLHDGARRSGDSGSGIRRALRSRVHA